MSATYTVGSLEFVKAQVTSDTTLNTQPVEIYVNGAWESATWVGTVGTTRTAETLVDFADAATGYQTVYVRITDTPEIPIINAGPVCVSPLV